VLAKLNIFAFLFATVGGLGAVFAFFVIPEFRGLNRISIFISFFSLLAVAILLQHYLSHFFCKNRYKNYVFFGVSFLLIIFAIFDQIPRGVIGQNPDVVKSFYAERNFFRNIENSLPKNAMVFQYPYVQYPEVPPLYKEGYNEYFKPYLQTVDLLWSYGAVKGRTGDVWNRTVTKMPPRELLGAISKSGFAGILVNTLACKDGCKQMLEQIAKVSGSNPLISPDGTFIFYKLAADSGGVTEPSYGYAPGAGFYGIESDAAQNEWSWAGSSGILYLYNFLPEQKEVLLDTSIVVLNSDLLQVSSNGAIIDRVSIVRGQEKKIHLSLKLNPGKNAIHFNTNTPTVTIPPDSRRFGFRVSSIRIKSAK
jgi:phosphoglycerol transferase